MPNFSSDYYKVSFRSSQWEYFKGKWILQYSNRNQHIIIVSHSGCFWLAHFVSILNTYVVFFLFLRDEFNLKLALLSNQWQGVIRRAQQRRGIIDSQIRQWQRYREMAEKLRKWLVEVTCQSASGLGSVPIPLQRARALLDEMQVTIGRPFSI